jgi:hypothetical protein
VFLDGSLTRWLSSLDLEIPAFEKTLTDPFRRPTVSCRSAACAPSQVLRGPAEARQRLVRRDLPGCAHAHQRTRRDQSGSYFPAAAEPPPCACVRFGMAACSTPARETPGSHGPTSHSFVLCVCPCAACVALQESLDTKYPMLNDEYKVYRSITPAVGVPKIKSFGRQSNYLVLVMEARTGVAWRIGLVFLVSAAASFAVLSRERPSPLPAVACCPCCLRCVTDST